MARVERDRLAQRPSALERWEPVDERHRGAAQVEEPEQRSARPRHGECHRECGNADRDREGEPGGGGAGGG
jgi:hypothetical protein